MNTFSLSVEERVVAGADMLEALVPGWLDVVDVEKLDFWERELCAVGQVAASQGRTFGEFIAGHGLEDLKSTLGYAFDLADLGDILFTHGATLTAAWKAEILKRRNQQ